MKKETAIIWLIVGLVIQGLFMQWRFTGTFFSNSIRAELVQKEINRALDERERFQYEKWDQGICFWGGKYAKNDYRVCPMILQDGKLVPYQ